MFELEIRAQREFNLYQYQPSLAAAAIFVALFSITTGYHIFQAAQKRTLYFIPLIVGGVFEAVGYVGRALASKNETSIGIFILQTITLLVAPALFAASIYMILGRIILLTQSEAYSPIKARWLTKIFVFGDVFSFLVQCGGGGMMAKKDSQKLGKNLILVGLFIQIIFFGFFLICACLVHFRLTRGPTPASTQNSWAKHMYMLYTTGMLILVRSLFRVAEFAGGHDGPLQSKEIYLYIFDSVLMLGTMVAFNVVHPGAIIGRKAQSSSLMLGERDTSSEGLSYERK